MIVLIPAYEPDARLLDLVTALRAAARDDRIVIVDDGSGPEYESVFVAARRLGVEVIGHPQNRGKGCALKQGFAYIAAHHPGHDVVTADCDGQHQPDDILRVADRVGASRESIVLGSRRFTGKTPTRSRLGNALTRILLQRLTGLRLNDTQTGLRGFPAPLLPWLTSIEGERFEYELKMLLAARRAQVPLVEVSIATVYVDGNRSSHFNPVLDSIRVYVPLLKFGLSSIAAFVIDATLFFALLAATSNLLLSVIGARFVSASFNFLINDRYVFRGDRSGVRAAWRYGLLVVVLLVANYLLLLIGTEVLGIPVFAAKLATEMILFFASYFIQRTAVFQASGQLQLETL